MKGSAFPQSRSSRSNSSRQLEGRAARVLEETGLADPCDLRPRLYRRPVRWKGISAEIRTVLEATGIEFIDENCGGPGVRLRKRQPKKG